MVHGDDSSSRRAAPGAWEYWRAQIEAHRGGGLSQMAFCARHGLRKGTFNFCKLRRAVGTGAGRRGAIGMRSAGAAAFVPIQITAPEVLGATALEALDGEVELTLGFDRRVCAAARGSRVVRPGASRTRGAGAP